MICPYCDQNHADDARFCPVTGNRLIATPPTPAEQAPPAVCMHCGKTVQTNWVVCGYCGKALRAHAPVPKREKPPTRSRSGKLIRVGLAFSLIPVVVCVLIVALIAVDPFGLHLFGRLTGRYDAAATVMPADTDIYLGFNFICLMQNCLQPVTDAYALSTKPLPQAGPVPGHLAAPVHPAGDNPFDEFFEKIYDEAGIRVPEDLESWAGQYAGVGITFDDDEIRSMVISIEARSNQGADQFLANLMDEVSDRQNTEFEPDTYRNVKIFRAELASGEEFAVGRAGRMVIIGIGEDALEDALDAQKRASVASSATYQQMIKTLPFDRFATLYITKEVSSQMLMILEDFSVFAASMAPVPLEKWQGTVLSARFTSTSVQIDVATAYDHTRLSAREQQMMGGAASPEVLLNLMPEDTLFFYTAPRFDVAIENFAYLIGEATGSDPDEQLDEIGRGMGIDIQDDLIPQLNGQWVLALRPDEDAEFLDLPLGVLLLAQVKDARSMLSVVEDMTGALAGWGQQVEEEGDLYEIRTFRGEPALAMGMVNGTFVIAPSIDKIEEAFTTSARLAGKPSYQAMWQGFQRGMKPVLYLDVAGLIDFVHDQLSGSLERSFDEISRPIAPYEWMAAGQKLAAPGVVLTRFILSFGE